ncbi:MAG: MFS transporter, partial [Bacteroidales bacterium]|nr:MFS transporter [Bacteroidales bacterium]
MKGKKWYPWLVVALLWGVALLNYLDRQMLSTMRPSMMADISELAKAENFGRLMAVFLWIYGLMSPVAGLIADRINRKWLIIISLAVWSTVTLLMGCANDLRQLYVLRALMGLSEALYIPAGLSLIAEYHQGTTRSLAVGIHMTGIYTGQALGGFGAAIAHKWSWQTTFQSFGLAGLVFGVILIFFLHEKRPQIKEASTADNFNPAREKSSVFTSLRGITGMISFWIILIYFTIPGIPGWGIKNWLPTLFSDTLGVEMYKAGPLSTVIIAVSSFAGVLAGGFISDRWVSVNLRGRIFTSAIGVTLLIPSLILTGNSGSQAGLLFGAILFGIGFGMFDANNMPILCQFISPRNRAAGYGIMNMAGVFSGALVTFVLGKSTDAGHLGRDLALLAIPVAVLTPQITGHNLKNKLGLIKFGNHG